MGHRSITAKGFLAGVLTGFASPSASGGSGSSFMGVGDLPGGSWGSGAMAVSADGMVVVGWATTATGEQAFRWTQAGGMVGLGDLAGGSTESQALGVNGDGSIVVGYGNSAGGRQAFRWTQADGISGLGHLGGGDWSDANGVSADGLVVVGRGNSSSANVEAFRWTSAHGMESLGDLPGGQLASAAAGVSNDGSVIVGASISGPSFEAFRWEAGVMSGLGDLDSAIHSEALAVSADGSVVVGMGTGNAQGDFDAFRWTSAGGMIGLGDIPGVVGSNYANAVNEDGSIIVGQGQNGAFIWDEINGMRELKQVLESEYGLDLAGWTLFSANGISADGTTIVGEGLGPDGPEAWIAVLDAGTPARVATFTVQTGAHVAGNTADLRESDNGFLKLDAAFINGGNPPYQMIVEVKLTTQVVDPANLQILVESKLSQNGGTSKLYLRNWAQGGWTLIMTDPIGKTEMTQSKGGLNAAKYINASGVIKLRIKHTKTTSSNGDPFRSLLDHVQALVR